MPKPQPQKDDEPNQRSNDSKEHPEIADAIRINATQWLAGIVSQLEPNSTQERVQQKAADMEQIAYYYDVPIETIIDWLQERTRNNKPTELTSAINMAINYDHVSKARRQAQRKGHE